MRDRDVATDQDDSAMTAEPDSYADEVDIIGDIPAAVRQKGAHLSVSAGALDHHPHRAAMVASPVGAAVEIAPPVSSWSSASEDFTASFRSLRDFHPAWTERFLLSICHPGLYVLRFMMLMFSTFVLLGLVGARRSEEDVEGQGGGKWFAIVYCGYGACVLLSWVFLIICSLPRLRPFAVRHRDAIACAWLVVALLGVVGTQALTELRRATFNLRLRDANHAPDDEAPYAFEHLTYNVSRSHFLSLPLIQCTDADEEATLMTSTLAEEPGCALRIVYGPIQVLFLSAFMCMSTLKMGPRAACNMVIVSVAGWALIVVISGHAGHANVWLTLLLVAIAGPVDILQCVLKREDEKLEFVAKEATVFAARQHHDLLSTIIPPNVLEAVIKMQSDTSSSGRTPTLISSEVPHGTLLFCAWSRSVVSVQDFERLGSLIRALDCKVKAYGFYKYQVGGPCVIIVCERSEHHVSRVIWCIDIKFMSHIT